MDKIYFITGANFQDLVQLLKKDFSLYAPAIKDPKAKEIDYYYQKLNNDQPFVFNSFRNIEPLKTFFTPAREILNQYFSYPQSTNDLSKTLILGVKSCDLAAHKIQDFVFLEGVEVDSLYRKRRENTILISSDCTDFKAVCHCLAWEIMPYPTEGFDLNLSPLNDGYLVEVGSEKGEALIQKYQNYFLKAKETQILARQTKRENVISRLKRHLQPQNLVDKNSVQRLVKEGFSLDTWQQFMLTCVECGGCNLICDTCHCFLLADEEEGQKNNRLRFWDSCQYANFAKVAGGANPLRTRTQRLRNRFLKKFDFFLENLGMPACCGCGRCIEVCPGEIDIREVLKDLAKKLSSQK
jgi:hypothetical protein